MIIHKAMNSLQVASTSNKEPQTLRTGLQCSLSHFQPWKCSTWWNWWALTVKTSLRGNLFSWGHGVSGMGLPKKLHKLSQPSPTWEGKGEKRGCQKKFSFVSPPLCSVHLKLLPWLLWKYFQHLVNQKLVLRHNRSNSGVVLDISCFPQRETKILLAPLENLMSTKTAVYPYANHKNTRVIF